MTPQELLAANGITLKSTAPGRHYTICPQCSRGRAGAAHQRAKVLGVTIEGSSVHWGCNHCGWTGPKKGIGKSNGQHRDHFAATHDYTREDGTLVFQKVRNPPGAKMRFYCRRPDGNGSWINNLKGIDHKPLYRWPEVDEAMAQDREIAIAEGESDVDALWEIGIPATCNFDGAADVTKNPNVQPKWKPEYSQQLAGARLIVFNDHDPPGYAHAEAVCRMSAGVAKRVRKLELAKHWPQIKKGGDIRDWLRAGHTREQLDALIEQAPDWTPQPEPATAAGVSLDDFRAYMPAHSYIFAPTRELWPASSVNARVPPVLNAAGEPMKASTWLDINAAVEQMTWAPGEPMLIRNKLIADGGWFERPGCTVFNLYRPSAIVPRGGDVERWLSLVRKVFPDQDEHIVMWLAHRVQRPFEKVNHALVLGGKPGIGKDAILEPVKQAIGPWNFADVTPKQVLGRFSGHLKSVILRISEARDLGEFDRFAFYDHTKAIIAAPPDVLRIDEKNLREYYVPNLCGVVITSNPRPTASSCQPTTAGISWRGRRCRRAISKKIIGSSSTVGIAAAAPPPSPTTSPAAISPASTPRPHRPRPPPSGRSPTPTERPRTPSLWTYSTRSEPRTP
jgi:hypothetical protein